MNLLLARPSRLRQAVRLGKKESKRTGSRRRLRISWSDLPHSGRYPGGCGGSCAHT